LQRLQDARAIGLGGIVLLLLPFIPFLNGGGNAQVWIQIAGFNFQPGEIAKICLAIFFAGYLVRTRESLATTGRKFLGFTFPRAREFGPILVIWLVSLAIIAKATEPTSVGLLGNAAEVLPEMVARGIRPDAVTDQTSAETPHSRSSCCASKAHGTATPEARICALWPEAGFLEIKCIPRLMPSTSTFSGSAGCNSGSL
jgi:hypothetical protein